MAFLVSLVCFALVQLAATSLPSVHRKGSVNYATETKQFIFKDDYDDNAAATGTFKNEIAKSGWSYLNLKTNAAYADEIQAQAAGILEARLTYDLIHATYLNTLASYCPTPSSSYCRRLNDYLVAQRAFVDEMIAANGVANDFWHQVGLVYAQVDGLTKGYAEATIDKPDNAIDKDFIYFSLGGDLEDLEVALGAPDEVKSRVLGGGSCSAIIKLLPDKSELFTAHDTWGPLTDMVRIYKRYEFSYRTAVAGDQVVPGSAMALSSYPGSVVSGDDFYVVSSGLVAQETTNGNENNELWKYVQPRTVLEFVRSLVANRLAVSGESWAKIFEQYNSGTYNNQWMIVDYKLFKAGEDLPANTLWILEQLPGYVEYHDMTGVLKEKGYWASYNIPAFPTIFNMSGMPAMVEKYGDWFTHDKHPRALMFARNQSAITDLDSLYSLMRYNNYKHDPLSRCNCTPPYTGENAIAARSDLNPSDGKYPFAALGLRNHAATDTKIVSSDMAPLLKSYAVSGPTHIQQPVFVWSESPLANTSHVGMPDRWDFDPEVIDWSEV